MIHLKAHLHLRFKLTVKLHLKIHMVMHTLVQKNAQSHLIKCELEEALYVALESAPKISL